MPFIYKNLKQTAAYSIEFHIFGIEWSILTCPVLAVL